MAPTPLFRETTYELPSLKLTALKPDDAPALAHMMAGIDPWAYASIGVDHLTAYLQSTDPSAHKFRVTQGKELVGTVCIRYPWLKGPYIELFAIDPAHQGRGAGSQIIDWICTQTQPHAANVWLLVSDFNGLAISFYRKHGFQHVTELEGVFMPGLTEILMRKRF